jgi:hypothetical protein
LPTGKKREQIAASFAASFVWKEPGGITTTTMMDIIPIIIIIEITILVTAIIITGETVLLESIPGMV